jgi:uncharacterized RDD family membrane protein YckC
MAFGGEDFGAAQYQRLTDTHYIDTPEQVELHFNIAGIGSRFVAVLLDNVIIFGALLIEVLLFAWLASAAANSSVATGNGGSAGSDTAGKWFIAIVIFANFAFIWGYFSLFEAYWHGQTPGKRVMKLRVIKDAGRQITFFESLARNLLRFVDYLPAGYLVGLITMLCNKSNKRLGDFVAGTIVVHERLDEQPMLVQPATMFPSPHAVETPLEPWRATVPSIFAADAVAKLNAQDLIVMEAFFARALDLSLDIRAMMAERIMRQMTAKMGVPMPEGNPERAMESLAYVMRQGGVMRPGL